MRTLLITLALALAACGGKSNPAPAPDDTTAEPGDDTTGDPTSELMTPEECEADGGQVVGDIGDGSVQCPEGFDATGNVSGGVEASLCCHETPDDAE